MSNPEEKDRTSRRLERFWKKVSIKGPDDCWEWTGSRNRQNGYGKSSICGRPISCHRLVAYLCDIIDDLDTSLHILHKCDNPICVNPKHLYTGTQNDNMQDKMNKGRGKGINLGIKRSKFTDKQIDEMCKMRLIGYNYKDIAIKFNVSITTIWRHILKRIGKSQKAYKRSI